MADFFDKLSDGISKGFATVSTGSKTMVEKTKINSIIKNIEGEKKQLAEVLGLKVFNYCLNNAEGDIPREEVISICNEIIARNEKIEQNKQRIAELDREMSEVTGSGSTVQVPCKCGQINVPGAKFCAKCGSRLN